MLNLSRVLGVLAALATVMAMSGDTALANHVQCGDVITQDTTLDSDLTCANEPALVIGADGVTLDLGGYAISTQREPSFTAIQVGDDACSDVGAPEAENDVTIEDGTVHGSVSLYCTRRAHVHGLAFLDTVSQYSLNVSDSTGTVIEDNRFEGTAGSYPEDIRGGIQFYRGSDAQIRQNYLEGGTGILIVGSGQVADNVLARTRHGIGCERGSCEIARNRIFDTAYDAISCYLSYGDGGSFHDNVIVRNDRFGIGLSYCHPSIKDNVITENGADGIYVGGATGPTIQGNEISHNGANGVRLDPISELPASAAVIGNRIAGNALDGIFVSARTRSSGEGPPLLIGNTTDRNGDNGIDVENPDTTVTGNHAWWNGNLGIEAVFGTLGSGNWAKHNGNPAQCVPGSLCSTKGKPKN